MFLDGTQIKGGCYLEFQYCKVQNPIKDKKADDHIIEHWKEDSILISDDEWNIFYKDYGEIFECGLFPNGEYGFYHYGVNYYDKATTQDILQKLSKIIDEKYKNLIYWLEVAINKCNGFYILGV